MCIYIYIYMYMYTYKQVSLQLQGIMFYGVGYLSWLELY